MPTGPDYRTLKSLGVSSDEAVSNAGAFIVRLRAAFDQFTADLDERPVPRRPISPQVALDAIARLEQEERLLLEALGRVHQARVDIARLLEER